MTTGHDLAKAEGLPLTTAAAGHDPDPDHDHEYMVPNMVPDIAQRHGARICRRGHPLLRGVAGSPVARIPASGVAEVAGRRLAQGFSTSRLRYALVIGLSVLFWLALYRLVREGFYFMKTTLPLRIHEELVQAIFNFFFFASVPDAGFSSGVILFGCAVPGWRSCHLLTMPIHEERIFQHKFQHAVVLEQLGLRALGQPDAGGLRRRGPRPVVLLCHGPCRSRGLCVIPAGIRGNRCSWRSCTSSPQAGAPAYVAVGLLVVAVWCFWSRPGAAGNRPASRPAGSGHAVTAWNSPRSKPLPNWWLSSGLLEAAGRRLVARA